ncbi:MAG: GTPase Era, partial [Acidimicrobiia bacterium]|nr:GTPase Era [Acidimicrobiia bacterium]
MKSGFVSVVGRPNVGKSSLVNELVGSKVAITSPRPQTTRMAIRGVLHDPDAQIVFTDTPGLHRPRTALGSRLNRIVYGSLEDGDGVLFVIDASKGIGPGDQGIAKRLMGGSPWVVVAVNKTDRATPAAIGEALAEASEWGFDAYVPTSARTGDQLTSLRDELVARLAEGPEFFPRGTVTDQPEQLVVAEIVREKFLSRLRDELPHSLTVQITDFSERKGGELYVAADLVVERRSQKGMVVGKG